MGYFMDGPFPSSTWGAIKPAQSREIAEVEDKRVRKEPGEGKAEWLSLFCSLFNSPFPHLNCVT